MDKVYDLAIIGGGINGVAIANDAAGRGLSVLLVEQNDLASGTSSASSKLIHGGLRYLETYEFRLVRESLQEREVLLRRAPHLVHPLMFVMPYQKGNRPAWMIRLGLFFYDHLARRKQIAASSSLSLQEDNYGKPLQKNYQKGFSYWDCATDDSRLVVLTAKAAKQQGATILTRWKCLQGQRKQDLWQLELENQRNQEKRWVSARCLVNAAGPWVQSVITSQLQLKSHYTVQLVQGTHIIVPKMYDEDYAYILQNNDGRVVFVLPYGDYQMIGTTDVPYYGDPAAVHSTLAEQKYLCDLVNGYFSKSIHPTDIIWSFAGVRVLADGGVRAPQQLSRDYILDLDEKDHAAPLLSVLGGKLTTHRILAENALKKLADIFPQYQKPWTAQQCLPGGDIGFLCFNDFYQSLLQEYPWVPAKLMQRYAHAYGSLTHTLLNNKSALSDLGHHFGHGLYAAEVAYLKDEEWAQTAEDILWRRSKLGLQFKREETEQLSAVLV